MRRVGIGVVLLVACAPPAPAVTPQSKLVTPPVIAVAANPPPAEACVPAAVEKELACRPGDVRVSPDIPVWPSAEYLFHYPPRKAWVSPVLPAPTAPTATSPKLDAAEKAYATAIAKSAVLEERELKKRAPILDPLWKAARDAYVSFLKESPPELRAYANARIAALHANLGQFDDALAATLAEIDALRTHPNADLAERALRDLGRFYARSKRAPEDVGSFNDEQLESIADAYVDAMRYEQARTVTAKRTASACVTGARQLSVWIAQSGALSTRLLGLAQDQLKLAAAAPEDPACRTATIALATEIATTRHIDATGAGGVRGSGDMRNLETAKKLYDQLVNTIPPNELARWNAPWLPDEQRPTEFRLRFAQAQLTFFQKDWAKCGPAYEAALAVAPDANSRAAAASKATKCFGLAATEARPKGPMTSTETELVRSSSRSLCTVAGDQSDVALARGRVFYRTEQWEKAVATLAGIASTPGHAEAREAAALYLVALYRLRETSGRAGCQEQLERERAGLVALHCSSADEDAATGPSVQGVTVSDTSRLLSPCEAMRAVGAPLAALPSRPKSNAPRLRGGDSTWVSGRATPETLAWVGHAHLGQWQACYDLALDRNPYVSGYAWLSFVIGRDGSVSSAQSGSDAHDDPELDTCLSRVSASLAFWQPEGGIVDVTWRLAFDRSRGVRLFDTSRITQINK